MRTRTSGGVGGAGVSPAPTRSNWVASGRLLLQLVAGTEQKSEPGLLDGPRGWWFVIAEATRVGCLRLEGACLGAGASARFPASSALQMFTAHRQTLGMGDCARAAGPRPSRPPGGGRATPSQPRELSSAPSRLLTVARGTAAAGLPGCGRSLTRPTVEPEQARGPRGRHCCSAQPSDALARHRVRRGPVLHPRRLLQRRADPAVSRPR
jgi:hypothetical protein